MKTYRIIKGKQIPISQLAANSRRNTVKNCTIPKVDGSRSGEWKIPKEGYPQPKTLRKKYKKKYYNRDGSIRKIVTHSSDYSAFPDHTFRPKGKAWYMEQVTQHKIAKWERKNPCPVKEDKQQRDLFEHEYLIPWKAKREQALERIRDFVVSVYDKLPLSGRFELPGDKYVDEPVAEIKDINMEGHKVNELKPEKSKLLKKVQKVTNHVKAKRPNLVCTNLKDHKRQKGRIILPQAA